MQADLTHVIFIPEPELVWASRLELMDLARCKRIEHCQAKSRQPKKDGWLGAVPAKARDPQQSLLHFLFFSRPTLATCHRSKGMGPVSAGARP